MLSRAIVRAFTGSNDKRFYQLCRVFSLRFPSLLLSVALAYSPSNGKQVSKVCPDSHTLTYIASVYIYMCSKIYIQVQYVRIYTICVIVDISFRCLVLGLWKLFPGPSRGLLWGYRPHTYSYTYTHILLTRARKEAFT